MRHVFLFITGCCSGLCSGLLYGLLHTVLLLDRFICAIYALPLWRWLGRWFRQGLSFLRRRRLACATAIFVPVLTVPCALLHSGTLVTVGGTALGIVEDATALYDAIDRLEVSASAFSGQDYTFPLAVETQAIYCMEQQFLPEASLEQQLLARVPDLDRLAVISVDGEQAGVCRSAQEAQLLLNQIKNQYTTATDEKAEFVQAVRVENVVAETALVSDVSELLAYLAPRLDVRACRSVTYTEHIPYETITRENDQQEMDWRATIQEGQPGKAIVTAEIETVDGQEHGRTVLERTVLSEATDEIIEVGTKNRGIGCGTFRLPLTSYTFTSAFKQRWGRLHSGVDLATPEGSPVYAADNGKVIVAECGDGYGNYIILDHNNGFKTVYGHNSELLVSVGDFVQQGSKIALSGNTGNSTGPHLHFEIRVNDEPVDPQQYLTLL